MLVSDLQNDFNSLDVDDDGYLAPVDALVIINELQSTGSRSLNATSAVPRYFIDVDGDNHLAPIDALLVINRLNLIANTQLELMAVTGGMAPESDLDGNGIVLRSAVAITGQTLANSAVRVHGAGLTPATTTADGEGRFQFSLQLPAGFHRLRIQAADSLGRGAVIEREVRHGDVVLNWNASLLNVIRDWTTLSNDPYPNRIVTERPPVAARNLAMVHAAIYDAINAIEGTHQHYLVNLSAPAGVSPIAAAAAAAHRVASQLYTAADERQIFDAALAESLATVPDSAARTASIAFGQQVGDAVLAARANDGSTTSVAYSPGTDPGDWSRTFPDFLPPLLPQWPGVRPFAMTSGSQFRPAAPPALDSAEYAAAVDEVMQLGSFNSTGRSPEQTEIALFWADGGGTVTPPGHWNQIAVDAALQQTQNLAENARMFALLNIALADAGISAWDAKYAYDLWRPIDAIREAETDGNPQTNSLANWIPLLKTPPFPTYTSGHSTFSGAADVVLTHFLGDNVAFQSTSDDHNSFSQRPLAADQRITRSFPNFTTAATEAGRSRIYGGIHFQFDNEAGMNAGRDIGNFVKNNFLKPRT